jgi:hypothetical protein
MQRLRIGGLVFLTCFWASQGSADIFTWTDRHGVTHFSNVRRPPEAELFLEAREAVHFEAKTPKKPDATSKDPSRTSRLSRDHLENDLQAAKLDLKEDVGPHPSVHVEPGPVAPCPLIETKVLRLADDLLVRDRYAHQSYVTKYYSRHYYQFPPWSTDPGLYRCDKHRILRKSYSRPNYIKKPHRDLHRYKHDHRVKHLRGHRIGRFSNRAFPHIGLIKPQPTIGHHRGIHHGRGYTRR